MRYPPQPEDLVNYTELTEEIIDIPPDSSLPTLFSKDALQQANKFGGCFYLCNSNLSLVCLTFPSNTNAMNTLELYNSFQTISENGLAYEEDPILHGNCIYLFGEMD